MTDTRLDQAFAGAEVVFVGVAIEYSRDPPAIDPHGDYFTPVTYRVLERLKGGDLGDRLTVMHRTRFASATVDDELRLRSDVFGGEHPLVVFARLERGRLQSADRDMTSDAESLAIVAATKAVLSRLRAPRRDGG